MPNSIEFITAYLAIIRSGHIALPLDPAYKSLELDNIIEQVPPKMVFTDSRFAGQLSPQHQGLVLSLDEASDFTGPAASPLKLPADKQIATLTFTSGTTGRPKAVPNTHANHIWNIKVCSQRWGWTQDDTLLNSVPLSHMLGIVMGLSGAIYHGNTLFLQRWFDEQQTLEMLSSGKISFFSHAASAYVKLAQAPNKGYDLSKVRLCVSGAAPLPPAVWQEFKSRFGIEILETYGTSETGRIAGNELNERVLGSPGRPFAGVSLRTNSQGEIEVKSGGLFPGYYKNQSATKKSLTADGYWKTGDMGQLKDGYVFIKGRSQERIRRFGYTVSPRDVEWALHKHPKISDVLVMGRQVADSPDDELIYFVVTDLPDEKIIEYAKANLLFAWRPDRIIHLDDLPRTRSGKAKIGQLKEMVV